jgi:hypothetical protein
LVPFSRFGLLHQEKSGSPGVDPHFLMFRIFHLSYLFSNLFSYLLFCISHFLRWYSDAVFFEVPFLIWQTCLERLRRSKETRTAGAQCCKSLVMNDAKIWICTFFSSR